MKKEILKKLIQHYNTIEELETIKENLIPTASKKDTELIIKTKTYYHYINLAPTKDKFKIKNISADTLCRIIDNMIKEELRQVNLIIDVETDERLKLQFERENS